MTNVDRIEAAGFNVTYPRGDEAADRIVGSGGGYFRYQSQPASRAMRMASMRLRPPSFAIAFER